MALNKQKVTSLKDLTKFIDANLILLSTDTIKDFSNFGDALVFEGLKGNDFWRSSEIFMISVVVFDTLCTERLDAGHCSTEVDKRLTVMLNAGVIDEFGWKFGCTHVGEFAVSHKGMSCLNDEI